MRQSPWTRFGLASSCLVLALGAPASAGDLFHRSHSDCGAGCNAEVVKLPAQQITVETSRPRVIVNETRVEDRVRLARPVMTTYAAPPVMAGPMVATIYAPAPVTFGTPMYHAVDTGARLGACDTGSGALRAYHDLEEQAMEVAKLRAAHKAELAATERVHQRVSAILSDSADGSVTAGKPADTKCCDDVKTELKKLSDRIDELQKLVEIHDEVIKKKVLQKQP